MATHVAPILVPRATDDTAAAHLQLSASPLGSPMLSPKVAKPTDPVELAAAIRKQVEFYFSDANLPTDKHLLKCISKDPDGYVPLKMIANYKRVKGLTKELSVVTDALRCSSFLTVDEEGSRVRRTTPVPAFDTTDICRRTVVAEHLPDKPTIESVTQLFKQYGEVAMVRICSRGSTGKLPAWLNKAVEAINMGVGHGEFALVEFNTEEECAACVTKTKNPDNWRTSLRVRHLLPNFKPGCKGTGRRGSETGGGLEPSSKGTGRRGSETGGGGRRGSESGGGYEMSSRSRRGSETGGAHDSSHSAHHFGHSSNNSSSAGGGRRSMDCGSGLVAPTPGVYQPPSRRSLEFMHPHTQRAGASMSPVVSTAGGSSGGGADDAMAASAASAAAAAAAGLPVHLSPIRTQPTTSGGGFPVSCSSGGAVAVVTRLSGSPSAGGASSPGGALSPVKAGSPIKAALGGIGGSIGSPRTIKSPAPAAVANLIDNILAAPTGSTPSRDGRNSSSSGGRWANSSGLGIEVDRTGPQLSSNASSPAAAVAAAMAGMTTPSQSGSPRASSSSSTAGARESFPGGLRTPTRMSAAGAAHAAAAAAAAGSCGGSPVAASMAPHLAAQAAAAAACAMTSSPKASNAASWRSGGNTPTSSMPGTPLSNTCVLSISAGAAVGAELEAASPPAGAFGAFSVGSPNLSSGGTKAAPWVPASRLAHHQRMAAASQGGSSDGGSAAARSWTPDTEDNWRSAGGNRPPRGPRGSGVSSSGGGGSSGGGARQRRKSWHATEAEEEAVAAAAGSAVADAGAAAADGSNSDGGTGSIRKSGRQSSRLGQAGDYHATIEAIREASCELDSGAVGRAIAALTIGGGARRKSSSGGGAEEAVSPEADADGEHHKRRRARHRRSRSSGSRRQSMDDARPHAFSEVPASAGVGAVGLSPRGANRQGPLAPDEPHHKQHGSSAGGSGGEHHHHGHGSQAGQRGSSSAGAHAHDSTSGANKKKEKKDYASWAAATPEFRAVAAAAKHSSGGGAGSSPAVLLSTSPARSSGMMSPMRGQGGAFAGQAPGSPAPGHIHHLEHTARGPDGTRGFAMGRGRPMTPAAP